MQQVIKSSSWIIVRPVHTAQSSSCFAGGEDDRNFVAWLGETVAQAVDAATQHSARQKAIRALSTSIKEQFQLADILVRNHLLVWVE